MRLELQGNTLNTIISNANKKKKDNNQKMQ